MTKNAIALYTLFNCRLVETKPGTTDNTKKSSKRNLRQQLRQMGVSYIDTKGRPKNGRSIGPSCPITCNSECSLNFDTNDRIRLFEYYWSLTKDEKRKFVRDNVEKINVIRKRVKYSSRRSTTYRYYFPIYGKRLKVCQVFFCNTLDMSAKVFYRILKDSSNESN